MGECCSKRELLAQSFGADSVSMYREKLSDSIRKLQEQQDIIQKLSLHLNYFHQKSSEFRSLLYDLKTSEKTYLHKYKDLGESVDHMNILLSKLDTEVQAQFISERESTDLSKEELFAVIQTVRAQKQAKQLETLATRLRDYIAYPDKRQEFEERVKTSIDIVRKTTQSLLGYIRLLADAKETAVQSQVEFADLKLIPINEKLEKHLINWESAMKTTLKLVEEAEIFAQKLLTSFRRSEADLKAIKVEVEQFFERESRKEKATEVNSAAQRYVGLLNSEQPSIIRKSHRGSTDHVPMTPVSHAGSVYLEEYLGSLRRLCIFSHYRDGPVKSADETYLKLSDLLHAKADEDRRIKGSRAPLPLEVFLLTYFAQGKQDRASALAEVTQFMGGVDKVSETPVSTFALELLKFAETGPISLHEETFICRAFAELEEAVQFEEIPSQNTWKTAGNLSFKYLIPIVEKWFQNEAETGEKVMVAVLPELPAIDIAKYYILSRRLERNESAEDLFYALDKEKSNILTRKDFILRVKSHLSVMLPEANLEEVAETLDKTASDGIFRTDFNEMFGGSALATLGGAEKFKVSRMSVISALRKAFEEWKSELSSELYLQFIVFQNSEHKIEMEAVEGLIRELDPELREEQFRSYVSKLRTAAGPAFTFEVFQDFVLQYPIGKWAKSFFSKV